MNILPKKRWHVRNKDNIARVRKDELAAANEEKEKERRKRIAEQEAKIEALRAQTKSRSSEDGVERKKIKSSTESQHINLFEGIEISAKNREHEKELKEEKEKYEKQIGYLTYLGQNTNESNGTVSWYNKTRKELHDVDGDKEEKDKKSKMMLDPLIKMNSILTKKSNEKKDKDTKCEKQKQKSHLENSTSSKDKTLAELREKRLKREREEKLRIEKLLARLNGNQEVSKTVDEDNSRKFSQKYNSQFNPHLARQNHHE